VCISEFVALRKGVVKEEDITLIEVPLAALPL
jgi:hypothetical protein